MKSTISHRYGRWKLRQKIRRYIQAIDKAAKAANRPGSIYLMPTCHTAFNCLEKIDLPEDWGIISDKGMLSGKHLKRRLDPSSAIRKVAEFQIRNVISFTDQHVDAHVASILDRRGGAYLSGVEIVIQKHLGGPIFSPYCSAENIGAGADAINAISLIKDYYERCDDLGEEWLARNLQSRRDEEQRALLSQQISSFVLSSLINSEASIQDRNVRNDAFQRGLKLRGLSR